MTTASQARATAKETTSASPGAWTATTAASSSARTTTQQDEISANDRDVPRNALYLYGGVVTAGGSSRAPGGRIRFGGATPESAALAALYGCGSVTLIDGAAGDSLDDYRCFITTGDNADFYNYQPLNLIITPQERASFFTSANYNMAEDVEVYAEYLHSTTNSGFEIAELPFDSRDDDIVIRPTISTIRSASPSAVSQPSTTTQSGAWYRSAPGTTVSSTADHATSVSAAPSWTRDGTGT